MKIFHITKHIFVPHKGNDYKPHFFREHIMLTLLILVLLLLIVSLSSYRILRTTEFGSSVVSSVLIDLTNTARVTSNLPILTPNQQLTLAATLKGEDMLEKQYFSHNAPDGTLPWHWLTVAGYKFIYAGENLGINFTSSSKLEKAWLSSPKHRDNILNKNYEDVGIATVRGGTTDHPVVFIVQLFGKSTDTDRINKNLSTSPFYTIISSSASLYQKLIFNTSYYIEMLYFFLIILIGASLCIMIFIEISVQHYVHIFYGLLLCIVIAICIAINSFFV